MPVRASPVKKESEENRQAKCKGGMAMGGRHAAAILESRVCEVEFNFFLMGKGPLGEHQPRFVLADSTIRLLREIFSNTKQL